MKTLNLLLAVVGLSFGAPALASGMESQLFNLQTKIRACVVLPYTLRNNRKMYHALLSHCPEVQVVAKGKAKIRVDAQSYLVSLIATQNSDGDLFDVVIRNNSTSEQMRMRNMVAYGDVLLGVLQGNTHGLTEAFVNGAYVAD